MKYAVLTMDLFVLPRILDAFKLIVSEKILLMHEPSQAPLKEAMVSRYFVEKGFGKLRASGWGLITLKIGTYCTQVSKTHQQHYL
jgi:hypothetical protein